MEHNKNISWEIIEDKDTEAFFNNLHLAVYNGQLDKVEQCFKQGIDVNSKTIEAHPERHVVVKIVTAGGWNKAWDETALHIAARKGHMQIVKLLLDHDAQRGLTNNMGQTAEDIAQQKGRTQIVQLIHNYHGPAPLPLNQPINQPLLNLVQPPHRQLNISYYIPGLAGAFVTLGAFLFANDGTEVSATRAIGLLMILATITYGMSFGYQKANTLAHDLFQHSGRFFNRVGNGIEGHGVGNAYVNHNQVNNKFDIDVNVGLNDKKIFKCNIL